MTLMLSQVEKSCLRATQLSIQSYLLCTRRNGGSSDTPWALSKDPVSEGLESRRSGSQASTISLCSSSWLAGVLPYAISHPPQPFLFALLFLPPVVWLVLCALVLGLGRRSQDEEFIMALGLVPVFQLWALGCGWKQVRQGGLGYGNLCV